MKPASRAGALLIASVICGTPVLRAEELPAAGGTQFSMTELAEDGPHALDSSLSDIPIDARSRIVLRFDSSHLTRSDNEGRWQSLKAVLEEIKALTAERAIAVAALIAAQGGGQLKIKDAQKLAQAYNGKYLDFRSRVRKIIGEETFKQIDQAANKRAKEGRGGLPQELADWIAKELSSLTPSPDTVIAKAPEVRVEVVAFLEPAGQDRKPIHVENYDQLPEGVLKPLPRMGLGMSSEEQGKLNQDLEYARQAAQSIEEIRKQKGILVNEVMDLKAQLRTRLQQTLDAAEQRVQQLRGQVEALTSAAGADQKSTIFAAVPALASTASSLEKISSSIKGVKDELAGLDRLRSYDLSAGVGPALDAVSSSRTVALLGALKNDFQSIRPLLGSAADQVAKGVSVLAAEQQAAVQQEAATLKADLAKDISDGVDHFSEMLPMTMEMANTWGKMFRDARDQAEATGTLGEHSVPTIQRSLNDLLPATVDLRRSGVKNDDYLTLRIRVYDAEGKKQLEEKSYVFKIGSMGLYREYTGQLLFASPTSGPSKNQFQANAGVLVTWKYGYRKAEGFGRFVNALKPGVGIHATSLHQGGSTVEVGSGVAISLWDDLLTGGYGWNLGVTRDRPYFFVGIGILDLLHKMNKTTLPRQ